MAEGYLDSKKLYNVKVQSRGIAADGSPLSENSVKAMAEIGIDLSGLCSEQLTLNDIVWADKIICLSHSHKTVVKMYTDESKILVLGDGISDPFGQSVEVYINCRDEIIKALDALIAEGYFSEYFVCSMEQKHIKEIVALERICFSEPWSEESILDFYKNGTKFFVAEENGKVLGYVGLSTVLDEGYITNVAVFPEHRKRGIGKALLERVFSYAKDNALSFVSLEVRKSNLAAISLYEKLGFKTEGERKNFYRDPVENALIMTKRFEE
jgi:ribosomal-protein-alanine N-acetyltransferase